MGYRSDVGYVIKFPNEDALNAFKVSTLFEDKELRDALAECETRNLAITFHAESVKWYESYPYVDSHERLLSAACEEPFNAGVRFIRVGEEYDDVEVRDMGDDRLDAYAYITVHRSLEFS